MKVSVFGLGYVGSVSAAAFADDGHEVVGVDVVPDKVAAVNERPQPDRRTRARRSCWSAESQSGRLRATTSTEDAVRSTDLSLICVGTPSRKNGSLDLTYLTRVCEEIGQVLRDKDDYHVVVVRSTVLPGTTHGSVIPALEAASGKKYGEGFGVSVNPEFLREGTAIRDFTHPPLTLVGHNHAADAAPTKALYQNIEAPLFSASIRVAEMIKYTSNTWHAVKVVFANEIGNLCKRMDVDSHEVMDIFCQDDQAEPVALLPEAGVRVRRIVPAEGRARAAVPRQGAGSRDAARRLGPGQQSPPGPARHRSRSSTPAARRSACSASASRRAPTTCASRRW